MLRTRSPETTRERVAGKATPGVGGALFEPGGEGPHPGLLDTLARGLDPGPSLTDTEP